MATNLTAECKAGYADMNARNPYLFSSDSWVAFAAGQKLYGISGVRKCYKSRGYSVRVESVSNTTYVVTLRGDKLDDIFIYRP